MNKPRIRRLVILILAVVMVFSLAACRKSGEAGGEKFKIGFCMSNTSDAFVVSMQRGIEQKCAELGIELIAQGATKSDYTLQTPILESMANSDIDGLLIVPAGGDNMMEPIKAVVDKGIPVITLDISLSDESLYLAHVTSDNYVGGQRAAEALIELMGPNASKKVAAIGSRAGVDTNEKRLAGFRDYMVQQGYTIVSEQWCDNEPAKAASQTENVLLANPDVDGFFGGNLFSAQGVINGVEAARSDAKIVCFDAGEGQIEALENGTLQAIIVQKPMQMGITGVEYMYEYLKTGQLPAGTEKVTYLEPIIAYQDDLDNPEINKWFYVVN
ncbi:MAG: ABC transporter substrate-binding protein [Christensenellales bacterium]